MRKRVTLADVAARAGVDRSLVSRVLNNDSSARAREEVRQRIRRVADELGYKPNRAARTLRTSRSNTIGFVIPTFENPSWATILEGAEAEADARGLLLTSASADQSPDRVKQFFEIGSQGGMDGVLIGTSTQQDHLASAQSVPWLMVYRRSQDADRYVTVDDRVAAREATEHLIAQGHQKIVHIAGPSNVDSGIRRRQGYFEALTAHGLDSEGLIESDYTLADGKRAAIEASSRFPQATAAVVANFTCASGFLTGLRSSGIAVPDQLSVIAIQDHPLADAFAPALTTVRMPLFELGRRAIALLIDNESDAAIHEVITGGIEIIVRESTIPIG